MMIHAMLPVVALVATVELTPPTQEPGWQAWHGCWQAVTDGAPEDRLLCAVPGADAAEIRLITVAGGMRAEEIVLRADGTPRPIAEGGCAGQETARWSVDGRRVFVRTELDCGTFRRVSNGVIAMISEHEWVDIRAATIFDQHVARTQRYRAAPAHLAPESVQALIDDSRPMVQQTARFVAAMPLGMEEIVEAVAQMPAPAMQAYLAARGSGPAVNGQQLLQLARAGVPGDVIDVMVALAYPQFFNVRQPTVGLAPETRVASSAGLRAEECWDPYTRRYVYGRSCQYRNGMLYSPWGYGYGYGYGYSPYNYGAYGWMGYPGTGTIIVVEPRAPEASSEMIRGAGYTRGGSSSTRGTAEPRMVGTTSAAAGSTSSGSTSTTSGSSSDTGSSSGRTAVPRPGGGL
jgi:hypothetical protein